MTTGLLASAAEAEERQLTSNAINHALDNNDNYSADNRFLCFDTRMTKAEGNGSSTSILKIDIHTGKESVVYEPHPVILDPVNAAPGVIAASYNPQADEIIFIHGPFVSETPKIGFYAKTNRRGAVAPASGAGPVRFLDYRDVDSAVTPPGAHRGGTHRHEFSPDGRRVGFTYDDHLLPQYGRTIGMLTPHAKAPGGVSHWFTVLVPVVPEKDAQPGDLLMAAGDSWVGPHGEMRAFIGQVKEANGKMAHSLYVVDVPLTVDVTTAQAGTKAQYPTPPAGLKVRRLTHGEAFGIVRGSPDGRRIAYLAPAADGTKQVFLIDSHGSDRDSDPARRPVQVTHLPGGIAGSGPRWRPDGKSLAVVNDHGVAVVSVEPGAGFGQARFVSKHGASLEAIEGLVWSNDGQQVAFNRRIAATGKDAAGHPFLQIFLADVK